MILVNVFAPKLEKKQTLQVGSWMWAKKKKKQKQKKNSLDKQIYKIVEQSKLVRKT